MQMVDKLGSVTEDFFRQDIKLFMERHRDDPILVWYSADTTPLTTRQAFSLDWTSLKVRRPGKSSKDFMSQRCFLQAHDHDTRMLLSAPRVVSDKTAWTTIQCFRELVPLPMSSGHEGLCLIVVLADRALMSAVDRHIQELLAAEILHLETLFGEEAGVAKAALRFYLPSACCNHDCHGGLKRALADFSSDKLLTRNSYIVCESLRNSYDILVRGLPGWLRARVAFEDLDEPWLAEVWRLCQNDARWVDQMVDMQVRWHDGRLKVSEKFLGCDDVYDQLSIICLQMWQFHTFSESRWVTLGSSMRTLLGCMVLGLGDLVQHCLDSGCSKYFLKGFLRMDDKVRHFVGLASTCSFVSDGILSLLLEDDRLATQITEVDRISHEEVGYLCDLSQGVWGHIGGVCKVPGGQLRPDAILAALVSLGYFIWRTKDIREPPWTLCVGNVEDNLNRLEEGPPPASPFMLQLYNLLQSGFPREQIRGMVALIGNVSRSNMTGEQAHAAAAHLKKRHPDYETETLLSRALLLHLQTLLNHDQATKDIGRLERKLERLNRKDLSKFTGRQAFFQDLSRTSAHLQSLGQNVMGNEQQRIMKLQGQLWRGMNDSQKAIWEREAVRRRSEKETDLVQERGEIAASLDIARARARDHASHRPPLRMASCRLSDSQKLGLQAMFDSGKHTGAFVKQWKRRLGKPVEQPPDIFKAMLRDMETPPAPDRAPRPAWLRPVCRHRDLCQGCCFRWPVQDGGWRL